MAKCAACGKFLSSTGGATCSSSTCAKKYHLACLLLPESTQVSSNWKCPDCKKRVPRGDNTPVKDAGGDNCETVIDVTSRNLVTKSMDGSVEKPPSAKGSDAVTTPDSDPSLRDEIRLFRSELREVRDELREFRREMCELHTSIGDCSKRVDGLEARIEALENKQIVDPPDNIVSQLQLTVTKLQLELNDRDQELLSSDLEIANLPELPGENVLHTVGLVAAKLGVSLEERDIVFAQRVGPRAVQEPAASPSGSPTGAASTAGAAARGRRIVVRLARRALRDDLLQSARVRRGATTADLGLPAPPRRFFINERLTKTNKFLFYRAREAGGRLGWRYTWTKSGRILAKQGDGKPTHCIRSEEDIVRVFGSGANTVNNG